MVNNMYFGTNRNRLRTLSDVVTLAVQSGNNVYSQTSDVMHQIAISYGHKLVHGGVQILRDKFTIR